jgi:hypothetical protein
MQVVCVRARRIRLCSNILSSNSQRNAFREMSSTISEPANVHYDAHQPPFTDWRRGMCCCSEERVPAGVGGCDIGAVLLAGVHNSRRDAS